jgi:hypothetical protein
VEPDHGSQVGPATGQLEHQGATEAVADGGHPGRVDPAVDPHDLEPAGGDGAGPIGVVADGSDPLADAGIVEPESPAAVGVEGKRHVTPLGQPVRTLAMHVVEPRRLVSHQHSGQGRASVVGRHRQMPDHQDPAIRLVLDLARRHHPPEPTTPAARRATKPLRIRDRWPRLAKPHSPQGGRTEQRKQRHRTALRPVGCPAICSPTVARSSSLDLVPTTPSHIDLTHHRHGVAMTP